MTTGFARQALLVAPAALLAAILASFPAEAKDRMKDDAAAGAASPVIARVNGADVTKAEFDAIFKANQRFFDLTLDSTREKLKGKPLTDYLFREEVVQIRSVAQMYADALPGMKATIEQAKEKIGAGADFAEVAKEMSQEASSAEKGGSLGEHDFSFFVHPFNRVALSLKEGQVSDPVLSVFGYHLIKVDKIIPAMELKPKRVQVRHILIRYPSDGGDPRQAAAKAFEAAKVEVVDPAWCKKLPSYCAGKESS